MTVKTRVATAALALLGAVSLVVVGAAPATVSKGKPEPPTLRGAPKLSATPVFKLRLKPSQEVPPVTGLRADAAGSVTFDLERSTTGAIISGEVVFYVNYAFPSSVTITGLHVHQGAKGTNGPVVIDSGVTSFTDADGQGNVTTVVTGVSPTTLQAILDSPRGYYVNLHTSANPSGALRDQLHNPRKR
jgi:hypothetical protein